MQKGFFDSDNSKPEDKPSKPQRKEPATQEFSKEYLDYLKSPQWKQRRKEALERVGYRCERCHKPFVPSKLDVHHLTYRRLGKEVPSDLQVLCGPCHDIADSDRQKRQQEAYEDRIYENRLDGWARKRYGPDWESYKIIEEVEEEFDNWLDSIEDDDDDDTDY